MGSVRASDTDDRRSFARCARTHDLIIFPRQSVTKPVGQPGQMVLDIFYPGFVKQFQTLFEAVKQRRAARPAFPCKGSRFERLVAVGKIPRRLDRYPSDECWLYT